MGQRCGAGIREASSLVADAPHVGLAVVKGIELPTFASRKVIIPERSEVM